MCFVVPTILERKALHCSIFSPRVEPPPSWYAPLHFIFKKKTKKENLSGNNLMQVFRERTSHWQSFFSYFTFEIVSFGMKNQKKWPHGEEILKLRAFLSHSPEVRSVLACHIHSKKCHWLTGNMPLEVQGVGKNLPPEHFEGTKENPMATRSGFQVLLVCFPWWFVRHFTHRWPLPSTDTSSRDLKHGRWLTQSKLVQTMSSLFYR